MKRVFAALVLLAGTASVTHHQSLRASPQAIAEVRGTGEIPKNFKTYSLFLVCNPQWLAPDKNQGLYQLYQQFQTFGRTIGDDNLAVWFWKSNSGVADSQLASNVNVERSVRFCQAWKLKPSDGPHVVVTSTYPDESKLSSGLPANSAVFELANMNPNQISDLLTKLTDDLVDKGQVSAVAPAPPAPTALWVRLLEAAQQTMNSFGCAWSLKIDAGPLTASLQSCDAR